MGCKLQGVAQIASFLYKRRPGHLPYILLSNDTKKSHLELKRYLLLKVFLAMKLIWMCTCYCMSRLYVNAHKALRSPNVMGTTIEGLLTYKK